MDSVTKTGVCLRPSCTAIVWPSMSGTIIERRDQVLMTVLVPASFWTSTFFWRWSSMKGPFFRLRGIFQGSYQRFLPVRRRRTIILSLSLLGRRVRPSACPHGLTGWRPPEVLPSPPPCGWSTGFMATPRTVGRRPLPRIPPALPPLMLGCSGLAASPPGGRLAVPAPPDGGAAAHVHHPGLTGRQPQRGERALLGLQLDAGTGGTAH